MLLYHGSTKEIITPLTDHNVYTTDFGPGFYLSDDYHQAFKWSQRKARRSKKATINVYGFDENIEGLDILKLSASIKWVKYIYDNRSELRPTFYKDHDIVIGPTADGELFKVLSALEDDKITVDQALKYWKPTKYKKQYCFKTDKAIKLLKYRGKVQF